MDTEEKVVGLEAEEAETTKRPRLWIVLAIISLIAAIIVGILSILEPIIMGAFEDIISCYLPAAMPRSLFESARGVQDELLGHLVREGNLPEEVLRVLLG